MRCASMPWLLPQERVFVEIRALEDRLQRGNRSGRENPEAGNMAFS